MKNVTFITTCKGRLHHLKETLPSLWAEKPAEIIVVDYGCPQNTAQWVEENYPEVKLVRVTDDPGFCLPRGRNLGAEAASSKWLVFIDADVKVTRGWIAWMESNLKDQNFYRAGKTGRERDLETYGTVIVERAVFGAVEGYDEAFRGWGGEDDDLYKRLVNNGITDAEYPRTMVTALSHDDTERVTFHAIKEKDVHHIINQCYMQAKFQIMSFYGFKNNPKIEIRQQLMKKVKLAITQWHESGASGSPLLNFEAKGTGWLPAPYVLEKGFKFSLRVATRRPA